MPLPDWITADLARRLRVEALTVADRYRHEYRAERMGFHRRMLRLALGLARDYRRREHDTPQHEQRAA